MEQKNLFRRYWLLSLLGVLIASVYPLYMGGRVIADMIRFGTVYAENYPKYVIPYTPISLALLVGIAGMPLLLRYAKKFALLCVSAGSVGVFFASEFLLEHLVIVTETKVTYLESWQMYMCYMPPEGYPTRTWTEVNVLMGEYSPAFKLHFYLISVVLILSILNCFYGFARMVRDEKGIHRNSEKIRSLMMQSVASGLFLGMCIWACFTAFYRTGEIHISALSAILMSIFFVLFGLTAGIYVGSFTLRRRRMLSVFLPSVVAILITFAMYIGEMILLSGHLYRFGTGFFFRGLEGIVLAPIDLVIIVASGLITAGITSLLSMRGERQNKTDQV